MNALARFLSICLISAVAYSSSAACVGPLSYDIAIVPGFNFIANQLNCGGNTIPEIMPPGLPDGTSISRFDKATGSFLVTTYVDGAWEGDPVTLNPGEGAILNNPGAVGFLLTLGGTLNMPMLPVILPPGSCCLLSRPLWARMKLLWEPRPRRALASFSGTPPQEPMNPILIRRGHGQATVAGHRRWSI